MKLPRIWMVCYGVLCLHSAHGSAQSPVNKQLSREDGSVLLFEDFDRPAIDTSHWFAGNSQWGPSNNGVIAQNLHVTTVTDPATGQPISVLDAQAHGDLYKGPIPGIQKVFSGFPLGSPLGYASPGSYGNGFVRTGGVVWTKLRYGPAKYEIRMRPLQQLGGETAIWNYYDPSFADPGSGGYTELDVEMPANEESGSLAVAGLNSYVTRPGDVPSDKSIICNCMPTTVPNQADGKFHVYEIDWYDGSDGTQPRVQWSIDGVLSQTSVKDVPQDPAQLWIGNWPAVWSQKGAWNYSTQHQYVDYVKISRLEGNSYPSSPLPSPSDLTIATSSSTTVDLAWKESVDSRTVAGYRILANGIVVDQTSATHIELTGLNPGDVYSFTVEAVNTAMLSSDASVPVHTKLRATAAVCDANPTSPIIEIKAVQAKAAASTVVNLKWDIPVIGTRDGSLGGNGCDIKGYELTRSNGGTRVLMGRNARKFTDPDVSPGRYRYDVTPFNQFGIGPTTSITVVVP